MKQKKPAAVTGRVYRGPGARLAIVRANLELLKRLHTVRDAEGTAWWTAEALDYLKDPARFAEQLMHTCWACGDIDWEVPMERAHVVACCEGGDDLVSNFFLLCSYCHQEQPEASARRVQEQWLANREHRWDRIRRETEEFMGRLQEALGGPTGLDIAGRLLAKLKVRDVPADHPETFRAMGVISQFIRRLHKRIKGRSIRSTQRIVDAKTIRFLAWVKARVERSGL